MFRGSPWRFTAADFRGRRQMLKLGSLAAASWLTPVAELLARADEQPPREGPAQSIIFLWMAGGPSQLETFDPQPGKKIAGGTRAVKTSARDVRLAAGLPRLAEVMHDVSLVRSLVSAEGDHERGTYLVKTGYSPLPAFVHPSIGAISCHMLAEESTEIPRHISILPNQWPGRGGYLGETFDAFKMFDPINAVPDVKAPVDDERVKRRMEDLSVIDQAFARRRTRRVKRTAHREMVDNALRMMTSEQLEAFDVSKEPAELRAAYGDTPFGRGCLAARRLIEVGVRCVEVTLDGWDSHANNHDACARQTAVLDPAFSSLINDLKTRGLLERTVVICGGEFGRTPNVNPLGGRDHWPGGFSMALAGGGIRGGRAIGETDPDGMALTVDQGMPVANVHATVLTALGLDPTIELYAPGPRPIKLSEGEPLSELLV